MNNTIDREKKILLMLLPFWTPMIPPMGICSLKSYLEKKGFNVKTIDLNIEENARDLYYNYFNKLKAFIPENKRSNFYSIGHHVLRNNMMAHINSENEQHYYSLVKISLEKTFYMEISNQLVTDLIEIVNQYYDCLESSIINILDRERPLVLGLTVYRDTLPTSIFTFKLCKNKYPHILTVMGGAIFSEQLTKNSPDTELFYKISEPYIDKIIIGQGEHLFYKLLNNELDINKRIFYSRDIDQNNIDFDHLPIPDYQDIDIIRYPFMGVTGSNGCEYQCSFCNVMEYYGKYQKKDVVQLLNEMEELFKENGKQLFYLTDHMVNPIVSEISKEMMKRKNIFYWTAYLRVDVNGFDLNKVNHWRNGGLYCARIGIESGSQRVLDMIGKKITPDQSKIVISNLASLGIKTTTYWLVGHPDENEEDFLMTLQLLEEMQDDIYEAECDYFNYHYSGQSSSDNWTEIREPVFPDFARDILITQSWTLNCDPSREVIFDRLNRFVEHCKKLGIPNPYSITDINEADNRWSLLHKNSVPHLVDFSRGYIDDRQKVMLQKAAINKLHSDKVEFNL